MQAAHVITSTVENALILAVLLIGSIERKDYVDAHVNAVFWYFVVGTWAIVYTRISRTEVVMKPGRLWLAIVIGPLAWLAYMQTAYALVPWACRRPTAGMVTLLAVGVLALALSTAGLVTAWQAWRQVDRGTTAGRTRFMALTGIGTSALFVLVVVAGMLPLLILAPCS